MEISSPKTDANLEHSGVTPLNRGSSLSFSVGEIGEPHNAEIPSSYSVTAVLNYCKTKILRPYLRLLAVAGLRPISFNTTAPPTCAETFSYIYTIQVIIFLSLGYILQYMACFRRDRGFGYTALSEEPDLEPGTDFSESRKVVYEQICHGSMVFSYIVPSVLHLVGYLYAVYVFRSSDDDQLPSLMERVFLSLSNLSDGFLSQKRLVKTLWIFVALGIIWMAFSFISVNLLMSVGSIDFKWIGSETPYLILGLKILLISCTLTQDLIQATVISNYCLQAQLLTSYLHFLKAKILQYPTQPTDWMRDIYEFKKLLKYFNEHLAPAVCIFTVSNIASSISGSLWLFNYDHIDKEVIPILPISLLNVLLWILITLAPFVQASRLSNACETMRSIGHEVRIRPFCHQTTPGHKLDSILLYASSLKMRAKLFGIPVTGLYLKAGLVFGFILILVLGQLHYLKFN